MPSLGGVRTQCLDRRNELRPGLLHGPLQPSELGEQPVSEDGEDDERDAADGQPDDQDDHGGDLTAPEF
jgi:hypothetical protein